MGKKKGGEVRKKVERFKSALKKKFDVEKIILFGSAAKGKVSEHSDVDLILISRKYGRRDVFRIVPKLYEVWHEKQKIEYPVDIILLNTREFERLKKQVSIVSEALKEGIVI